MLDFKNMTVAELKTQASAKAIPNRSKLTKLGLIEALERAYSKVHRTSNVMRELNYTKQCGKRLTFSQKRRIRKNRYTHA